MVCYFGVIYTSDGKANHWCFYTPRDEESGGHINLFLPSQKITNHPLYLPSQKITNHLLILPSQKNKPSIVNPIITENNKPSIVQQ
jgi:hypothetical protein